MCGLCTIKQDHKKGFLSSTMSRRTSAKVSQKKIFSKIDLRSAYWQFPMSEESIEKTAFCPGPGYGLWEFTVMPYRL